MSPSQRCRRGRQLLWPQRSPSAHHRLSNHPVHPPKTHPSPPRNLNLHGSDVQVEHLLYEQRPNLRSTRKPFSLHHLRYLLFYHREKALEALHQIRPRCFHQKFPRKSRTPTSRLLAPVVVVLEKVKVDPHSHPPHRPILPVRISLTFEVV